MARKAKTEAAATEDEGGLRSRMWLHEALVEYINDTYDVDLDKLSAAEVIAWAFAKRNEFRGAGDDKRRKVYEQLVASHAAEKPAKAAGATKKAAKATKATKKAAGATKKASPRKATKKATASTATEESPFD